MRSRSAIVANTDEVSADSRGRGDLIRLAVGFDMDVEVHPVDGPNCGRSIWLCQSGQLPFPLVQNCCIWLIASSRVICAISSRDR